MGTWFNSQLITLQGELGRLHEENRKLRSMLDQITKSYSEMQGQLLVTMQNQFQQNLEEQVNIVYIYGSDHHSLII